MAASSASLSPSSKDAYRGNPHPNLYSLPDECLALIADKLEKSYDLAALSLVSRRCLKVANNAMRKLDVRSIPRDLQDEVLERLLNRFGNLSTLVWGSERVVGVDDWMRAYSPDPMARDSEEEEKTAQQAAFIAAKAPHLTDLAVEDPSLVLTPQALQALLSAQPRLMTLVLTGAFWSPVSQSTALAIVGGACPLLESFAFRDCSGSANASDSSKSEDLAAAKRFAEGCPRVRSLTLGEVNQVALTSTLELLKLCTGLEELSLHPRIPAPQERLLQERLLLQTVGRSCLGLTHLELHLLDGPTLDGILSEMLCTVTLPRLKVLRIFSNDPQEPVNLDVDIWRDFQARHPLIEECVVPCLEVLETLLPFHEGQLLWGQLRKLDPGSMYTDDETDFGAHIGALMQNCPLLTEATFHLHDDVDFDPEEWDALPTLPVLSTLCLRGDSDIRFLFNPNRVLEKFDLVTIVPRLRHLVLDADCTFQTTLEGRSSFFQGLDHLESLELSVGDVEVNPGQQSVIEQISCHCLFLKALKIVRSRLRGQGAFAGQFGFLERLELVYVTVDTLNAQVITSGCPKVESLGLKNCGRSEAIRHLLDNFSQLKHVSIEGAFGKLVKESLQSLIVRGCVVVNRGGEDIYSKATEDDEDWLSDSEED